MSFFVASFDRLNKNCAGLYCCQYFILFYLYCCCFCCDFLLFFPYCCYYSFYNFFYYYSYNYFNLKKYSTSSLPTTNPFFSSTNWYNPSCNTVDVNKNGCRTFINIPTNEDIYPLLYKEIFVPKLFPIHSIVFYMSSM